MKSYKEYFNPMIHQFNHYADFRDKNVSEEVNLYTMIKESDNDWSHITRHIHDNSTKELGLNHEEAHNGKVYDLDKDFPHVKSYLDMHNSIAPFLNGLRNHYNRMTGNDKKAINDFTLYSKDLNSRLLHGGLSRDQTSKELHTRMKALMNRHEPYPHGHHVWSGIGTKFSDDPMKGAREHGVTQHKMYISSSLNPHIAMYSFSKPDKHNVKNISKIYIPGRHETQEDAPKTVHISEHSNMPNESETVISPGHVIYHPNPTILHSKKDNDTFHIYHGMLVPKHVAEEYHRRIQEAKG